MSFVTQNMESWTHTLKPDASKLIMKTVIPEAFDDVRGDTWLIFSPLSFLIFVSCLSKVLITKQSFSQKTQLFRTNKDDAKSMYDELKRVMLWMERNKLAVNQATCKIL